MRIGHIAYSYKPLEGGAEHYIRMFLQMFGDNFEQSVYTKIGGVSAPEIKFVPLFSLPIIKRKPAYMFNLFLNIRFFDLIQEDQLIVHDPFHFWPVIWHKSIVVSHGVRWKRNYRTESLYNKIHLHSAKFAFKRAKKFVANDSDFFRSLGVKIKPKERMFHEIFPKKWFIPNCVDAARFKKCEPIASLAELNPILVPRNIVRGRGVHLAIEAFSYFHKMFPHCNLVVCGDFSDKFYLDELSALIYRCNLIGNVYFIGAVKWELMPRIYSSSLMTVIPTIYEEGTSLSALESMACGTATVSTNIGGLADLPTIQSNPISVDLSKKMIEVFSNKEAIGASQCAEVNKIYNLENFKKAWLEVIYA